MLAPKVPIDIACASRITRRRCTERRQVDAIRRGTERRGYTIPTEEPDVDSRRLASQSASAIVHALFEQGTYFERGNVNASSIRVESFPGTRAIRIPDRTSATRVLRLITGSGSSRAGLAERGVGTRGTSGGGMKGVLVGGLVVDDFEDIYHHISGSATALLSDLREEGKAYRSRRVLAIACPA